MNAMVNSIFIERFILRFTIFLLNNLQNDYTKCKKKIYMDGKNAKMC